MVTNTARSTGRGWSRPMGRTFTVNAGRGLLGRFSLALLLPDRLVLARDPHGNRPLSIAKLDGGYCVSSESCVFPNLGAQYARDVNPGSIVTLMDDGIAVVRFGGTLQKHCRF